MRVGLLFLFVYVPVVVFGADFTQLLQAAKQTPGIQRADYMKKAAELSYEAARGTQLPRVDLSFDTVSYAEQPSMIVNLPPYIHHQTLYSSPKTQYAGDVTVSYPLFTGFALSASVDKALWQSVQSSLARDNTLRILFYRLSQTYAAAYTAHQTIIAAQEALNASRDMLTKSEAYYREGLIAGYEVQNARSKYYENASQVENARVSEEEALNTLEHLSGIRIKAVEMLPTSDIESMVDEVKQALREREDLRALKTALKIDDEDIKIAKSKFYPEVFVEGALRRTGDSYVLQGDDYTPREKSYALFGVRYSLFDGLHDVRQLEAAQAKRLATAMDIVDYEIQITTDMRNRLAEIKAIQKKQRFTKEALASEQSFYEYTRKRFDNHIASSDEVTRAIASLSAAQSAYAAAQADMFAACAARDLAISLAFFESRFGVAQ